MLTETAAQRRNGNGIVTLFELTGNNSFAQNLTVKIFITDLKRCFQILFCPKHRFSSFDRGDENGGLHLRKITQRLGGGQVFKLPVRDLPARIVVVKIPQSRRRNGRVVVSVVTAEINNTAPPISTGVNLNDFFKVPPRHRAYFGQDHQLRRERLLFAQKFPGNIGAVVEEEITCFGTLTQEFDKGSLHIFLEIQFRDPDDFGLRSRFELFKGIGFKFGQGSCLIDSHQAAAVDE